MSRVVLIVDSDTGELIDVAGNIREGGRYKKFVKRMMSTDKNPVLDYGANGGDTLNISRGGRNGKLINILADTVNISGTLKVNGKTVTGGSSGGSGSMSDDLMGTEGEVSIDDVYNTDPITGETRKYVQISLHHSVVGKLEMIDSALDDISKFVSKSDILSAIEDLSVEPTDTLEDVKGVLRVLLSRLSDLAGVSSSGSSN